MAYNASYPLDDLAISDIPEAIRNKGADVKEIVDSHTGSTSGAHAASAISNTPAGSLTATTVQAAINELDSEKVALSEVVTVKAANKLLKLNSSSDLPASITGNAATATRLETAVTINGVSFNGTSNITIPTVPAGGIIMWSGSIASIPSGWALCNGQNGTPNLQDRFIVGAGASYGVGATGGETHHALSVEEMPPHNHALNVMGGTDWDSPGNVANEFQTGPDGFKGWKYTQNTGSGWGHENRPPYYALAYIMKL